MTEVTKDLAAVTTVVTPRMEELAQKMLETFKGKLERCNYTQEEIDIIMKDTKKEVYSSMRKIKISILWTIDLRSSSNDSFFASPQSKKVPKNLVDIFAKHKIDMEPLGFYNLQADFTRNTLYISEKRGDKPKKLDIVA